MKAKDCKKCVFVVKVYISRYFCRKLGMTVYPDINGCSPCCWFNYHDPSEDPKKPGDPYP